MYGDTGMSANALRSAEYAKELKLGTARENVNKAFEGFDDSFFKTREQSYLGYALPQINEQYQEARKGLTYKLAAQGLLKSGAAGTLAGGLEKELKKQHQGAADAAIGQSDTLRKQVEGQRFDMLNQAQLGVAPDEVGIEARKSASQFQQPSTFAPVGNMFADWTNTYLQRQQAKAWQAGEQDAYNYNRRNSNAKVIE